MEMSGKAVDRLFVVEEEVCRAAHWCKFTGVIVQVVQRGCSLLRRDWRKGACAS